MTHILKMAAVFAALSTSAVAGNTEPPSEPVIASIAAPSGTDWTGFYAGLQFDGVGGDLENTNFPHTADIDGQIISGFVGYRRDFGQFVLGAEVDLALDGDGSAQGTSGPFLNGDYEINSAARVGVELGYDMGRSLAYVSVGAAHLDVNYSGRELNGSGAYVGLGYDYLLTDKIILGAEVNWHQFKDFAAPGDEIEPITFGLNAAWRF